MQGADPVLLSRLIWFGSNEVRDLRCPLSLKPSNRFLQHTIGVGDTLMLTQMFKPGFHQKGLQYPTLLGGILEHAPCVGPIPSPLLSDSFERGQEWLPVFCINFVLDRHQHRPAVVLDLSSNDRSRPMQGGREVQ